MKNLSDNLVLYIKNLIIEFLLSFVIRYIDCCYYCWWILVVLGKNWFFFVDKMFKKKIGKIDLFFML